VRFQRQTLIARLCDRLGEPLMLRLPPPKTFASLARQFETRRCLMQFWNLNLWPCFAVSSMRMWRPCFR